MFTDETIFRSKELNNFIKNTDYMLQKSKFEHEIKFYRYERREEYNYKPYKIRNSLFWFNKITIHNFLSALCHYNNENKNNIVIYNRVGDRNIITKDNGKISTTAKLNDIARYYRMGKIIFIDCNDYKKSYCGLNPKRMINFLNVWWLEIIRRFKNKNDELYQILKQSNAIISADRTVEVIVYNIKLISREFLYRKSNMDIIRHELSKAVNHRIEFKYSFLENEDLEDNEPEEIENFLELIAKFGILSVIRCGYTNRSDSEEYLLHERGIL